MHTKKEIWISTVSTFISKFVFSLTFLIPVLLFSLETAIGVSIVWGLGILSIVSFRLAKSQGSRPWKVIAEHLLIACAVIIITHFVGDWISTAF